MKNLYMSIFDKSNQLPTIYKQLVSYTNQLVTKCCQLNPEKYDTLINCNGIKPAIIGLEAATPSLNRFGQRRFFDFTNNKLIGSRTI